MAACEHDSMSISLLTNMIEDNVNLLILKDIYPGAQITDLI